MADKLSGVLRPIYLSTDVIVQKSVGLFINK